MWRRIQNLPQETLTIIGLMLFLGVGAPFFFNLSKSSSPIVIQDTHPPAVPVPFTKLTQGTQSVVAKRVNYVLTSPTELNELWKVINAPGTPPKVDFKKNAVIAVFAGKESSSLITVAKIEDSDTRMVSIAIAKPVGPCAEARQAASPYEIVAVPTTALPFSHEDLPLIASCPK